MTTITITIRDVDGDASIGVVFDPPLTEETQPSPALALADVMLQTVSLANIDMED